MTLAFEDAEVVSTSNGGRSKDPNPYTEIIKAIALKEKDGKPVAKRFVLTSEKAEDVKTDVGRARRQLAEAGKDNDPVVTVQVRDEKISETETAVTFWTTKRIERKASAKPEAAKPEAAPEGAPEAAPAKAVRK